MTGHGDLLRPGEAAAAIGIKPSTLRVYVQRFGELLSDRATAGDGQGRRGYSERDLDTLRRARGLIARGLTYERALVELRGGRSPRVRQGEVDPSPIVIGLQALEQAVDAWRQLAEERANEIASLREDMRRLQDLLVGGARLVPLPQAGQRR